MRRASVPALVPVLLFLLCGCTHQVVRDWPSNTVPPSYAPSDYARVDLRTAFESLAANGGGHAKVRAIRGNTEAWSARWRMVADARRTIDVSYFILSQDLFGMSFLGHLLQKAREGVRVRVMVDAQGYAMSSTPAGPDCLPALAHMDNVLVKAYRPLPRRIFEGLVTLNPVVALASNHNKVIVADGAVGLIGGRNIEATYFAQPEALANAFLDMDVSLQGRAAGAALTAAFETLYESDQSAIQDQITNRDLKRCIDAFEDAYRAMDDWLRGTVSDPHGGYWGREVRKFRDLRGALAREVAPAAEKEIRVLNSLPRIDSMRDPLTVALFQLVGASQQEVHVESPYLVLPEKAVAVLERAGQKGVEMTIVTNSPVSTDNALSQLYFLEQWPELLAHLPRLRLFVSGTRLNVHGKFAVFDRTVVLIGTYNLDPLSMAVNGEIAVAVWSPELARQLAAEAYPSLTAPAEAMYEYRIQRDAQGQPMRDAAGDPLIAFGPLSHSGRDEWIRFDFFSRLAKWVNGCWSLSPPLFDGSHTHGSSR